MGPVLRVSGKCEVFCRAEPDAGTAANAGGGGAAHAASEARAQLELRNAGAGSAGQGGVSQFLPDRDGEGAGREDAGSLGTSDWCGHGARVARSDRVSTVGDPLEACDAEFSRLRAPLGIWGCN